MDSRQNKHFCTRYNATWSFQGETSNGHTALKAATYSAQELSYHSNLLPTIPSHIWLCSMDFMGFLHFCR